MKRKLVIVDHNATSAEGHFRTYTSSIASAAHQAGHDVTVLWNKRIPIESVAAPYRMLLTFSRTEGEAGAQGILPVGQGHFGYELDTAVRQLGLDAAAIVFIHTCHYVELVELLECLSGGLADENMANYHIVVRYDPELFQYRFGRLRAALAKVKRSSLLREKIRFHSDTRQLAEEHQKLFEAPFGVCPIPLDLTRLLPALEAVPQQPKPGPLTVTYLGTARTEKGYGEILGALQYMRAGYIANGRVRFVLQCSRSSLKSEPGLLDYQRELERYIKEQRLEQCVQLIKEPMEADGYYSLLAQSDVLLVGYSPTSYRYRSSGVLMEAMAAGKVVVTTSGSWMASQATPDSAVLYDPRAGKGLGPAIAEAVDRYPELRAGALTRRDKVVAECSPAAVVEHLIAASQTDANQDVDQNASRVLAVLDGDAMLQRSGRWSLFMNRLRYFELAGYRVAALFIRADLAMSTSDWRRQLSGSLGSYNFERVFVTCTASEAISRTGAFSLDGDLSAFLRKKRPQCVYLGAAACFPLLQALELDDAAVISEADSVLAYEDERNFGSLPSKKSTTPTMTPLLTRRRFHIIASSRNEAEQVRVRAPDADIVDCGVLFDLSPLNLCCLAGPVDCFELVASAKPRLKSLQLDASLTLGKTGEALKLSKLTAIDLLFVGSADSDVATSLRWFLEEVYAPFLAEHEISLLVAGGVADLEFFPQFEHVVLVGPCDSLAPLYAAAKIVLVLSNGKMNGSLELWEAVTRCKPVVAAAAAVSGLEHLQLGVEAHDDPDGFADGVLRLLKSQAKRLHLAKRNFEAVKSLEGSGGDNRHRMNQLFRSALGERALAAQTNFGAAAPSPLMEWTNEISIVNRVLRNYLLNQPLEGFVELFSLGDQGAALVREIADCLLKEGSAPFLEVDVRMQQRVANAGKTSRTENIAEVIRIARSAFHAAEPETPANSIVINRRLPAAVSTYALNQDSAALDDWSRRVGLVPKETAEYGEPLAWSLPADTSGPELFALALPSFSEDIEWVVYQDIPVASDTVILGRHTFAGSCLAGRYQEGKPVVALCVETAKTTEERMKVAPVQKAHPFDIFSSKRRSRFHKWAPWAKASPLFDEEFYLDRYPDVAKLKLAPFKHYERYGANEGRNPNGFFDVSWYLNRYPDVRKSKQSPLDHYLEVGWLQGNDPSPRFSSTGYFEANPDARDWNMNPLWHYLSFGRREKREIRPAEPLSRPQTLILPTIMSVCGSRWVEIKVAPREEPESLSHIEIFCNEQKLDLQIECQPKKALVRSILPLFDEDQSGVFPLRIALADSYSHGALEILGIRLGWRSASGSNGLPARWVKH